MDARKEYISTIGLHSLYLLLIFFSLLSPSSCSQKDIKVGVILDMESWNGMMVKSCITMAISDFYDLNAHYKTRIVLQTIHSKGDPLQAVEAALSLVVKNVEAMIVGPQMSIDAKLLALMGGKAEVPISESNSANYGVSEIGKILLNELLKTRVIGLSGEFQIVNMKVPILKAFEIVNVIREGERRVGFWAKGVGIIKEITHPDLYHNNTEVIIWPGGSITTPRGSKKLKVGLAINPEFNQLTGLEHDPQTNTTRPTGFCVEVFEAALKALPYDVPFEYTQFEGYMSDLVNQIYLENFDAGVGDITIMAARSVYVDFTIPYTDIGVGTIAKMKSDKDMWIFARPVGVDPCVLTAVIFVVTGIVIWVIEKPTNREFQGSPSEQIGTIFLSALFFSNREKLSSNLSRFVMLIWAFLVVILSASYTATLTSMLTVQQIKFASKGANVGYQVGPIVESNIRYNLSSMDYKLMPYSSLAEYARALSKGSKNGGSDGIIDEIPYVKAFLSQYSSDYAMVDSAPITNGFGYPFRKGSPLVPDISREIARLREDGTLEMWRRNGVTENHFQWSRRNSLSLKF